MTRRTLLAGAAGTASLVAVGAALPSARAASRPAPLPRPGDDQPAGLRVSGHVPHVERTFEPESGFLRPRAWGSADGRVRLTVARPPSSGEPASIEVHDGLGAPVVYSREQVVCGLLDERIRRELGEGVLQEVLEALARRASFN